MENKLIIGGVVVALILGVYGAMRPESTQVVKEVVERVEKLGASPGNDLPGPVVKINGAPILALSKRFNVGTTSICSFDMRPYASSSIIALGATVNGVPTTTGLSWKWYWGIGQNSSTTLITGRGVTATGTSIMATTTLPTDTGIVSGNRNYLVLDFEGGSQPYLGMEGQTGNCSVLLHSPSAQ